MYCPQCGAPVQPYDRFCIRCGHDMHPDDAVEQREAAPVTPLYGADPNAPATARLPQQPGGAARQAPYGDWDPGRGQNTLNTGGPWASGSSTPTPNPYGRTPAPFGNGTPFNGRYGRNGRNGQNGGLLQGLGAAIIALFVILGKFGAAIASFGIFKLWFLAWIFRGFFGIHFAPLFLIIILLLIIGSIAHSRGMV